MSVERDSTHASRDNTLYLSGDITLICLTVCTSHSKYEIVAEVDSLPLK